MEVSSSFSVCNICSSISLRDLVEIKIDPVASVKGHLVNSIKPYYEIEEHFKEMKLNDV